ncbi:MLO-like protein 6 isoform X2 [Euphorbia lathyris]|uniref:MLO-like protein 6 isoform X2 n=1 Tax=Euphorbia lathyris TaxID=212925 RepID=UPI003313DC90
MERKGNASLQFTPTWAIAIICLCIILISFSLEAVLHFIRELLAKRRRKSLVRAMEKIETEMMTMGFISLLLTISEVPISKICVRGDVVNSFHPCKKHPRISLAATTHVSGLSSDSIGQSFCQAKGMVSLISREGVGQLKNFISVLAVFHVFYCILTMFLGMAKMRRWRAWEEETQSLEYQIANDPRRFRLSYQTSFGRSHLKMWKCHPLLIWLFSHSASKSDYFTLRNGFILANYGESSNNFNFYEFLATSFDDDFEQVVRIRLWIWMMCLLFIFFSAQEFHDYYWLPFLPLMLALAVGTKLQTIITKMCLESCKQSSVIQGTFLVKPSNHFFWFNRPNLLLYLIQFILIQNSFQLAFFTWGWYEYGLRSCMNQGTKDAVISITTGIIVQLLCGYVTLPIYALVTQMGCGEKKTVFSERVIKGLRNWQWKARNNVSPNNNQTILLPLINSPSVEIKKEGCEITAAAAAEESSNIDDEISFASSWKKMDCDHFSSSGEFRSVMEEEEDDDDDEEEDSFNTLAKVFKVHFPNSSIN